MYSMLEHDMKSAGPPTHQSAQGMTQLNCGVTHGAAKPAVNNQQQSSDPMDKVKRAHERVHGLVSGPEAQNGTGEP